MTVGHTLGDARHKDADCTSGGYDCEQCSACGKYFAHDATANAANSKSDYSSFTTLKLNHLYYKIVHWFWKLFKIHKTCDCGAIHY